MIVIINLNVGPFSDGNIDNFGHIGGLITGIITGVAISEWLDYQARRAGRVPDRFTKEEYESKWCDNFLTRWIGNILLIVYFVTLFVIFFVYIDVDGVMPPVG